jgi:hypothetical protein
MAAGRFRSLAAACMIAALVWIVSTPATSAGAVASWGGRVFEDDRSSPREGVVVSLTGAQDGGTLRSAPTRADGAFTIEGAPVGTYDLRVETSAGVFVSSAPVKLEAGANAPMALALKPGPNFATEQPGLGKARVGRTTELLIAGAVTMVALYAIYKVTEDDDEIAASVF